jgi:oxygen-dependent protoporphyrinogen oxidase
MTIVVIGAGPAGCAAAHEPQRRGREVVVLESSDAVGGRTRSHSHDGFTLPTGAIFLMSVYEATHALIDELGHTDSLVRWRAPTALVQDGRRDVVRYDAPVSNMRLGLLTVRDRLRLAAESLKVMLRPGPSAFDPDRLAAADTGEDLESWTRRTLGDNAYEYIVRPNMEMLYAVPVSDLSISFQLAVMKTAARFSLAVPREGMGIVCDWLAEGLYVRTNTTAEQVLPSPDGESATVRLADGQTIEAEAVVVATPAPIAANLLDRAVSDESLELLRGVTYTEYAHVVFGYERDPMAR